MKFKFDSHSTIFIKQYHYAILTLLSALFFLLSGNEIFAQGEKQTIVFSGIVVEGDSAMGVPGAHVYVHGAGIGTITDIRGIFSISAKAGDTVMISSIGYELKKIVVPQTESKGMMVLVDMEMDNTILPIVEVFPYLNERHFKEAFLAMGRPDKRYLSMKENLNATELLQLAIAMPMDGDANSRYWQHKYVEDASNRFMQPSYQLLDPFRWAEFIRSIKRGDLKRKDND